MTSMVDQRFGRLFAALAARDLETARQQLDTLAREAPGDRRLGDAAAGIAALTGRLTAIPGHLSTAAGAVSSGSADFPPIAAPYHPPSTVLTDHPDQHTLRRIPPQTHATTVIQETAIANADWSGLAIAELAFAAAEFSHLRVGEARLDSTVWDRCAWNAVDFSRGEGEGMSWSDSTWAGVIANGANLSDSRWHRHQFRLSQLMNADFGGAVLSEVRFDNCEVLGARFESATLIRVRFGNQHGTELPLGQVSFREAMLVDCDLSGADLTGADFTGAVVIHTAINPGSASLPGHAVYLPRPLHRGHA